jgi:hypothetical protein
MGLPPLARTLPLWRRWKSKYATPAAGSSSQKAMMR